MTNQLKLPWRTQDASTQPTIAEIRKQLCEHYAALNESERYKNPPQKLAEVAYLYGLRAEPVTSDRCAYLMWEQVVLVLIQVGMETVGLTTPPVMEWATGAVWVMRETQSVFLDDLKKLVGVILADDDTVTLEDPQLVAKVDLAYSDRTAFSAIEGTVALLTSLIHTPMPMRNIRIVLWMYLELPSWMKITWVNFCACSFNGYGGAFAPPPRGYPCVVINELDRARRFSQSVFICPAPMS